MYKLYLISYLYVFYHSNLPCIFTFLILIFKKSRLKWDFEKLLDLCCLNSLKLHVGKRG